MSPFSRCATYAAVDTRMLHLYGRDLTREALTNSIRICSERGISPVQPIKQYPLANMGDALRLMQSGGHIGKLVLLLQPDDQVVSRPQPVSLNDPNSTYLVAGGVGGIGRSIVLWMLEKGARNILLVSRSASSYADAPNLVQNAEHHGCNLQVVSCDISDEGNLLHVIAGCDKTLAPIRGVIHGAMVLDHAVHPKIAGSLNLHNPLPDLNFFIMLSSLVGVVGYSSQSNYVTGNTFKDARLVAKQEDAVRNRIENLGTTSLKINDVLRLVEVAIQEPLGHSLDEDQLVTDSCRFTSMATEATPTSSTAVLLGKLTSAQTMQEAASAIAEAIASKLADIFRMDVSEIDTGLPLSQYGVDSLVAVELRNWLRDTVKAKASIFDNLQGSSLNRLGALVASRGELVHRLQAGEDDAKN
ncbi:short chain dehydrogenase domain-containing protein [Trichoderma barbatum]